MKSRWYLGAAAADLSLDGGLLFPKCALLSVVVAAPVAMNATAPYALPPSLPWAFLAAWSLRHSWRPCPVLLQYQQVMIFLAVPRLHRVGAGYWPGCPPVPLLDQ